MARHTDKRRSVHLLNAVIVALVIALILAFTAPWSRERERQPPRRAGCPNYLKQLGLVIHMYENESRGHQFPRSDGLKFLLEDVYPYYWNESAIMICAADEKMSEEARNRSREPQWALDHSPFWYIGHVVTNDDEGRAYIEAYRKVIEEGDGNLNVDLDAPSVQGGIIYRNHGPIIHSSKPEESDATPPAVSQSEIPLFIEYSGKHPDGEGHVLYMDGHVETIKYPGKFPMTKAFIEGLKSLEALDGSR
jgi:prepilin-type processing-associated H-X9-DG protein